MSFVVDSIIVFISQIFFFISGWIFFLRYIFRDYEVQHKTVLISFSTTFALSCSMFELIIFEILGYLDEYSRRMHWYFQIYSMLINVIIFIPFNIIYFIVKNLKFLPNSRVSRIICACFLWLFYMYIFWKIGNPFPIVSSGQSWLSLAQAIGRVSVIGVTIMAMLSGFGAVNYPYTCMTYFMQPMTKSEIVASEKRVLHTTDMIIKKKRRLLSLQQQRLKNNDQNMNKGFWGMLSSVPRTFGSQISSEELNLEEEIKNMESFQQQLFLEHHDKVMMYERVEYSRTLKGKYFNVLGYFFCVYCCWKIFISTVNILLNRVGKQDPISRGIYIMVNYFNLEFDVNFWSQQVSFWLVGIIVITSIRGLLITLTKFFYAIASSKSNNIIVLILAQIMGMYFLSSVLLMRMNMPHKYRVMLTHVLTGGGQHGQLQFHFYHRWFDVIFLISAVTSLMVIYISRKHTSDDYSTDRNADGITDDTNPLDSRSSGFDPINVNGGVISPVSASQSLLYNKHRYNQNHFQ